MDCVVAPLDQRYPLEAGAERMTSSPAQNVVGPSAVMAGDGGSGFTVTATGAEVAEHPLPSVTWTVRVSLVVTTTDCDVEPSDQSHELPALAVRVTLPPAQNVVGPLGVIVGADGAGLTVTTVGDEVAVQPSALVTSTVMVSFVETTID